MFFGFLSSERFSLADSAKPVVVREGFQLYLDPSDRRSFYVERPKSTLAFRGKILGQRDLGGFFHRLLEGFETHCDPMEVFGPLDGDYCIVVYHHAQKEAYISVDRFARGEVYWRESRPIAFFTDPGRFSQAVGLPFELNLPPLLDRFSIGAVTPPETVYQRVFAPVAGEYVTLSEEGTATRVSYWSPLSCIEEGRCVKTDNADQLTAELKSCFLAKVKEETEPYRKLGVGLSGGMDSASILGAARRGFHGDIVAVTVAPDGPTSADLPRARTSASFNRAEHLVFYPTAKDLDDFPYLMGSLAQPFRSNHAFMNYQVSKQVAERGGECVLWGYGADLILGNAGYCRRFFHREAEPWPSYLLNPAISILRRLPQNRYVVGLMNRGLWRSDLATASLAEKYFRVCKKPRFFQERRLFREDFLKLGREREILSRISGILRDHDEMIVDRLIEADYRWVHTYQQISCTAQVTRINGVDSILTYYNKDYAEVNLKASDRIRAMGGWNKYILRQAFRDLVHTDIYNGARGACTIKWDRIISGPFRKATLQYLQSSEILQEVFRIELLDCIHKMIKHPGLMLLNLLGLALWYDIRFKGISAGTPLSTILDYSWKRQDEMQ